VYIYENISLNFFENERYFRRKFVKETKTRIHCSINVFAKIVQFKKK
jgi:hypothetical protein